MSAPAQPSNTVLVKRLLALGWTYRRRCLTVLGYQSILLALGLFGLGLTGVAVDVIRHQMDPHAPLPRWPLGWTPPAAWSAMGLLLAVGVLVLAMAVLRGGLNYLYTIAVGQLVHAEIVPQMRTAAYDKLQRMSFRFFDATASGSIINRVTSDVQSVRAFVDQVLIQSVILVLTLGVYVVYMMQKHVGLTFACISTSPFLWLAATLFSRWVQPAYAKNRKLSDDLVTFFSETVQGIRVLKGFAREPQRLEAFEEKNRLLRDQQYGIFRQVSLFSPALDLLSQANLVVLLAFGASLVIQGRLTLGDLIVFAGLLQQFAGQVTNLANIINTLQQSLISARRVFEVMDAPLEIESPPAAARPQRLTGAIRFENVDFGYRQGEQPCDLAVTGIDFEARPGQRVILFGETGSGKSTILSLIPRFYDPARGRVLVDGADVRGLDLEVLRGHTGVVFQESFLFSAGIADNIGFGRPQATQQEIEAAAKLARAHEFILGLPQGYETVVEEGGANLSGGQRQRLAIARALLRDPAILLLDDPTAAVDAQTEDELLAALGTIAAGRTTLIATHRLGPCYGADLILVLHDGRIVERGTHDQLLAAGGRYFAAAELHRVAQVRRATA